MMKELKVFALAAVAGICLLAASAKTQAQISVGVNIGPEPACPYGYYDYAPYACAPYGYYGPEWFTGGIFIGAGPWFHGPANFRGHVNNHYDVAKGYRGPAPNAGDKPDQAHPVDHVAHFKGNEVRDGRGHVGKK
jgi:hypothetical protein